MGRLGQSAVKSEKGKRYCFLDVQLTLVIYASFSLFENKSNSLDIKTHGIPPDARLWTGDKSTKPAHAGDTVIDAA